MIRSYTELTQHITFADRYQYLKLDGRVGKETFGFDRYINQMFYSGAQWRQVRSKVIARDYGLDLGVEGHEIYDQVLVHHMNPMTVDHIQHGDPSILDPEFLISVSLKTHNAIHYGDDRFLPQTWEARSRNDTTPWKQ